MKRMNGEEFPLWMIAGAWGWIVLVVGISALYRKTNGKPIIPRLPSDALYCERRASGRWANNALMVAVTKDTLSVTPYFPFTLGFLPEFYRLEHCIPLKRIRSVTVRPSAWGMNAVIRYGPEERTLKLKLRNADAFANALAGAGVQLIRT
ncbi:hypothetical protein ABS767_00725 [Sphingomonas sp. ST-64]|uniref:Uncharacterized protein n=1 Tax=Sphingomonas plantiphila TaxID=3163295 RepID=A0ABW8YGV0_9SPHN